jgi:hypothetical protein
MNIRMLSKTAAPAIDKDARTDAILTVESNQEARRETRKAVLEAVGIMGVIAATPILLAAVPLFCAAIAWGYNPLAGAW